MKPRTYDMTFCVSKCKNKCKRHYSQYEFERGGLYSMSDFNCEKDIIEPKGFKLELY